MNLSAEQRQLNKQLKLTLVEAHRLRVHNISQVGVSLEMTTPLHIGDEYRLFIYSDVSRLVVNAKVARCNLDELVSMVDGRQQPVYHAGLEFIIPRNETELQLLQVLKDNAYGEKRAGVARIRPAYDLRADLSRDIFLNIHHLNDQIINVDCKELLDMDEEWRFMLERGDELMQSEVYLLQASRKEGEDFFNIQAEFLNLSSNKRKLLQLWSQT